jgi:hypothetical protein
VLKSAGKNGRDSPSSTAGADLHKVILPLPERALDTQVSTTLINRVEVEHVEDILRRAFRVCTPIAGENMHVWVIVGRAIGISPSG